LHKRYGDEHMIRQLASYGFEREVLKLAKECEEANDKDTDRRLLLLLTNLLQNSIKLPHIQYENFDKTNLLDLDGSKKSLLDLLFEAVQRTRSDFIVPLKLNNHRTTGHIQ